MGRLTTPHGSVETPAFVAVGTHAALKATTAALAQQHGQQLMFCNTYHLLLHPGPAAVAALGGLHRFTGWQGPILTDSGGFQVFSLAHGSIQAELKGCKPAAPGTPSLVLRVSEDGVLFR